MNQMVITPLGEVVELTCWSMVHRMDMTEFQPNYKERCCSERWLHKEGWMDLIKCSIRTQHLFGCKRWSCPSDVREFLEAI
jgi:hypothetical protein